MYWIDPTDLELPPPDPDAEIDELVATAADLERDGPWIRPPACWTPDADARGRAWLAGCSASGSAPDWSRFDLRRPAPAAFDDDPLLSWDKSD